MWYPASLLLAVLHLALAADPDPKDDRLILHDIELLQDHWPQPSIRRCYDVLTAAFRGTRDVKMTVRPDEPLRYVNTVFESLLDLSLSAPF